MMIVSQETLKQISKETDNEMRGLLVDVTTNCQMYKVHHSGNRYYLKDNIVLCQRMGSRFFEVMDFINNEEARKSFDEGE